MFSRVQSKCRGTEVQRWSRAGAGAGCRIQVQTFRHAEVKLTCSCRCRGAKMMEMLGRC